ncbi:MAG: L-lactate permease [Pseudomonadota bacterium]|nr:L-lactate permease [Pseudomonadota bacterium]
MWQQIYDPLNSSFLSSLFAALPVVVMLGGLGFFHMKAHFAAIAGLVVALVIAIVIFGMPWAMALKTAFTGGLFGLLPIGWIILNIIFLYKLTSEAGLFKILQESIAGISTDRRVQLLLVAFSFGAFFEGAAGFGTPVAVTGAVLIGLGFSPLAASGLSLIANTAPVAFGALGTPILTLAKVTGLDAFELSAMVGRQLPFFSLIVPFWLIWAFVGFKGMMQIWPAILVAGVFFAVPQFLVSNYMGPELVDVIAAIASMAALAAFLKIWQPGNVWTSVTRDGQTVSAAEAEKNRIHHGYSSAEVMRAWTPWVILSVVVFLWGTTTVKNLLNGEYPNPEKGKPPITTSYSAITKIDFPIPGLSEQIQRMPPVAPKDAKPEKISFTLNWLSTTGTGILLASLIAGIVMGIPFGKMLRTYGQTIYAIRYSLLTIVAMLALGFVTRYSGVDVTLGLAFAATGPFYPFFGTLLGWLGVALTGSDTASNVLFGGLQKTTSEQLGLSPILMCAANSSGGVMGKMIDAQSIVVASTATNWFGHEGEILRYVFFHSVALACLVGLFVTLQAYVPPFTDMVIWPR